MLHAAVSIAGLYLAALAAIHWWIVRRRGFGWPAIGFRAAPPEWYVIALVGLILWWAADYYLYQALGMWDRTMAFERQALMPERPSLLLAIPLFLAVGPIAALMEETLFRGLLYQWMRHRIATWPAILASAAVFSLVHFHILAPSGVIGAAMTLEIFAIGIGLAYLFEKSRSLWPGIVLHAANNLGAMAYLAAT